MPIDPVAAANDMADLFFAASDAVDQFRLDCTPPLPRDQVANLKNISHSLETRAQFFTAAAIGATLKTIEPDLQRIHQTTTQATQQLKTLKDVAKGISIATSLLSLGTAIAAGDPLTIVAAVAGLSQLVT